VRLDEVDHGAMTHLETGAEVGAANDVASEDP